MRLKVYQQGGGLIYSPFIKERGQSTISGSQKSGSDDDPKLDPLDKELLALMKDKDLLPSDIEKITNSLIAFQRKTQHLSDVAGFGGVNSYRSVMPGMLQIMQMTNNAAFYKKQWDNAVGEMKKHEAGAEVALDSYGRMFVLNKDGEVKRINPGEFNKDEYTPLSNSQFLNYRENVAGMDNRLLGELADMTGKQDVYKAIDEIIKAYGTTENAKLLSKDKAVQEALIDANSPDGIYKISQKYSKGVLQGAAQALYNQLPTNMQNLLKANAALGGQDPMTGALYIIQDTIFRNISDKTDVSYDATASKAGGSGNGSGGTKVQDTYEEHLMNDPLSETKYTKIQPGSSNIALYAYAQDAGPILDKDGKTRFQSANLTEIIDKARGLGAIIDASSMSFGDHIVERTQWSEIVSDNSSNMQRVWLPIKPTGDGRFVPDLKSVQELNEINDSIKNNFGENPNEVAINEWLKDKNINAHWDSKTKSVVFDRSVMRPFLAIKAYADKNSGAVDVNSPYVKDITGEPDAGEIKDIYNNAAKSGYALSKKDVYGNRTTHAKRNIYSGVLYMPLSSSGVATSIFNTERFPVEDYMNIAGKAQEHYTEQQMQDGMTLNW